MLQRKPIYRDFEIRTGPPLGDGYPYLVRGPCRAHVGAGYLRLPFAWEEIMSQLASWRAGDYAGVSEGRDAKGVSPFQRWGQTLYEALFSPMVQDLYRQSLEEAEGRLRLVLTLSQPELARLPWEYLHDGTKFIGLDLQTPIVRGVVATPWPTDADRPLRLLIVAASPADQAMLDVAGERRLITEELQKAISRHDVVVRQLIGDEIEKELPQTLLEFAPHVLHMAGHGTWDSFLLEGASGRSRALSGTSLRDLLCNIKSLRLVVLNACDLAGVGERPRLSVAARLVQVGLPMAVGMQFPISDRGALAFSEGFYEALAQRFPLEAATAWARVRISYYLGREAEDALEWGTPVIYVPATPWQVDWRLVMTRALAQGLQQATQAELPQVVVGRDGKEMHLVPAGSFTMGTSDGPEDERPEHAVDLPAYWMDTYPVTNAEYARFVAATGHRPPLHWEGGEFPPTQADHPVVNVTWHDARAYAAWAGKRLPTEAEWEKAARGTDRRLWPWGMRFVPGRCNTREAHRGGTTPVDAFVPQGNSPYGIADLAGNVWEWTADWYRAYEGSNYQSDSFGQEFKVLRGGSWRYAGQYARCTARSFDAPGFACDSYGFRCVIDREMYASYA